MKRDVEEIHGRDEEVALARLFARFIDDESGATAIEYALIAAGIAMAIMVAVQGLGTALNGRYVSIAASLK